MHPYADSFILIPCKVVYKTVHNNIILDKVESWTLKVYRCVCLNSVIGMKAVFLKTKWLFSSVCFSGDRCEQCGLQDSTTYCANDGICTYKNQRPVCICKPGFDSRSNCENKTCSGYCLNNAPCIVIKNSLFCKCTAGFTGPRCETRVKDCSSVVCQNGGMYCKISYYIHQEKWPFLYKEPYF